MIYEKTTVNFAEIPERIFNEEFFTSTISTCSFSKDILDDSDIISKLSKYSLSVIKVDQNRQDILESKLSNCALIKALADSTLNINVRNIQ